MIKKVVNKYFGKLDLYLEIELKIWSLAPKITTWAVHATELA